ncbi:MADS-box protein AeAP3-2 [Nymphaea thermarum]|nr:MADS-box protein AeAP3-2 [Nymphaea thermarum]
MESGSATKRRGWLLTKAREVALRNDDQVGLIIFSSSGKMSKYCSPNSSMLQIIDRFKKASGTQIEEDDDKQDVQISYRRLTLAIEFDKIPDHCQQIYRDMTRMKNENDKLQATVGQLTGEDLTTLTKEGLTQLKKQLQVSIDRIGSREVQ